MWTTIYIAVGEENTLRIKNTLIQAGYILKTKFLTSENGKELYEILVPQFEAEEVQEFIIESGIL